MRIWVLISWILLSGGCAQAVAPVNSESSSSSNISSSSVALPDTLPTITLLPWNGFQGAYSLVMDDFCGGTTESLKRAMNDASSLALPISVAVITSQCSAQDWRDAIIFQDMGHELVNHSYAHIKADALSAEELLWEADSSTALLERYTGVRPQFFGYAYDFGTAEFQQTLQRLGYLGSRSYNLRTYTGHGLNAWPVADGFRLEYDAKQPPDRQQYQHFAMNAYADSAVAQGKWALRETHGIADSSFGAWTDSDYTNHLQHLDSLVKAQVLWVSTPSRILRYSHLAQSVTWQIHRQDHAFEMQWNITSSTLPTDSMSLAFHCKGNWQAIQNQWTIPTQYSNGFSTMRINPWLGPISLTPTDAPKIQ